MFVSWINAWHHGAGISLSNSGSRETCMSASFNHLNFFGKTSLFVH